MRVLCTRIGCNPDWTIIYVHGWCRNFFFIRVWYISFCSMVFIAFNEKSVHVAPREGVLLAWRETERTRYDTWVCIYHFGVIGKENSQKRTATNSVSSTIFSKIFEFTSSIRSGRSIASRLVKKSRTFSSSIKSPEIIRQWITVPKYYFYRSKIIELVNESWTWNSFRDTF